MVKFELKNVTTGWCKRDSGVRQGFPLSPLLFEIHICQGIRKCDKQLCAWKGLCHGMEEPSRASTTAL